MRELGKLNTLGFGVLILESLIVKMVADELLVIVLGLNDVDVLTGLLQEEGARLLHQFRLLLGQKQRKLVFLLVGRQIHMRRHKLMLIQCLVLNIRSILVVPNDDGLEATVFLRRLFQLHFLSLKRHIDLELLIHILLQYQWIVHRFFLNL